MTIIDKEATRVMALQKFGLRRLPAEAKEGDICAESVALVLKTNGKEYYVVMAPDREGNNVVKVDFEPNYGIVRILKMHPVVKVKPIINDKTKIESATRAEMTKWLKICEASMHYHIIKDVLDRLDTMSLDEMRDLCLRVRICQDSYAYYIDHQIEQNIKS